MVGFDAKNKHSLDQKFICLVCSLILRDPVQLSACGHRQCRSCFGDESKTTFVCPTCQTETQRAEVLFDLGFKNDMHSLLIECLFCSWNGVLSNYENHFNVFHSNRNRENCQMRSKTNADVSPATANEFRETPDIVMGGIQILNSDIQSFTNQVQQMQAQIQTLKLDLLPLKLGISESSNSLKNLSLNRASSSTHPIIADENIDDIQCTSCDGTYVWKIANFKEKMNDAQSKRQTSIYSPSFYSSQGGYKMCACLYLDGNAIAHRTHMSLFFVLMRSEFDAILKYPFNYKVTFCIYDQTSEKKHIIDSFQPDIKSNSFQRPQSEMNIASGIPKFYPLGDIRQEGNRYVKDDTMFIRIRVDFGNISNSLLPFAIGLDPGLPINIQQMKIIEEAERRAQQTH